MSRYDYIITGAGGAGLSLAYHFCQSSLRHKKILLLDKSDKTQNDRTWCYWSSHPFPYRSAQQARWQQLSFRTEQGEKTQSIQPLQYYCLRGLDFYQEVKDMLSSFPNIEWKQEAVRKIHSSSQGAAVLSERSHYQAKYVFNSIPHFNFKSDSQHLSTRQHFWGWFIETDSPVFDQSQVTLMDFSIHQSKDARFFYILPFSSKKALVEFTVFSDHCLKKETYRQHITTYLEEKYSLKPGSYRISEEERGSIPMTDYKFQRREGNHILHIGTAGGMTKATTGYTFKNIQIDSQRIIQSLEKSGHPFYQIAKPRRFRFYDRLLLHIIQYQPEWVKPIFARLFFSNDFHQILKFLDERSNWWEEARIFSRLPWYPFLKALYEQTIYEKITGNFFPVASSRAVGSSGHV